jgi:hypothetical protein
VAACGSRWSPPPSISCRECWAISARRYPESQTSRWKSLTGSGLSRACVEIRTTCTSWSIRQKTSKWSAIRFLTTNWWSVAASGHWAAGTANRIRARSLGERFILREVGSGSRRTIDAHLLLIVGLKLNVKLTLSSNEAIRELVTSGMGLAVLSRYALPANPAAEGLCILDVKGFPLRKHWRAVHLKSKVLSLPARSFLDELRQGRHAPGAYRDPLLRTRHSPGSETGQTVRSVHRTYARPAGRFRVPRSPCGCACPWPEPAPGNEGRVWPGSRPTH